MSHLRSNPCGAAEVLPTGSGARLIIHQGDRSLYSNAQLDDYAGLPRSRFPHASPLALTLRARFSHPASTLETHGLEGTAGFGFWNDPFLMTDPRPPTLPRALWFFYASPPSDMKLDVGTPGWGWKAAAIDALRPAAIGPALAAPALIPLMNLPQIYRRVWPAVQRRLRVAEALVPVEMTEWHTYTIEWGTGSGQRQASFLVDGQLVLEAPAPAGRLGIVIWCDNQYLIARPWGRLAHGLLETCEQWLEVEDINTSRLSG